MCFQISYPIGITVPDYNVNVPYQQHDSPRRGQGNAKTSFELSQLISYKYKLATS